MMKSIACAKCGQVDDLATVNPLGIHLDKVVIWNCRCGNTRSVAVCDYTAQELVRKAMALDEKRSETTGHFAPSVAGNGRFCSPHECA
jgi:hypothetical protein